MRPVCSATNTRPSLAKRTTVGLVRPLKAVVSWKPAGSAAPAEPGAPATGIAPARRTSMTMRSLRFEPTLLN